MTMILHDSATEEGPPLTRRLDEATDPSAAGPRKPEWPMGLKLQPHHFQMQDRYHEELVRHALQMALGQPWGVVELVIDEAALGSGQIAVRRLRAIFPDGTPVTLGGSEGSAIPPRHVDRVFRGRRTVDVYLGLPLERAGEAMSSSEVSGSVPARYTPEMANVSDYNTGRNTLPVMWGRPNVQILFEGEPLDAYSVLRVARLQHTGGVVRLDPELLAPVMRLGASPALQARLRSVETSLLATLEAIGELRITGTEMTGNDAVRFLLASTVGRELALLQRVLSSDTAHPCEAHRVLAELVGSLAAFTPLGQATIPTFDPLQLDESFEALEQRAREVLHAISAPRIQQVPLEQLDEHIWRADLKEPGIFGREFLLVLHGAEATANGRLALVTKVAAWEEIAAVVGRRIEGVTLLPEIRRPQGLTLPPQSVVFRLDKRSALWASIVKYGSLAVWPGFNGIQPMLLTQEPGLLGGA
jgi:type VI secretion system protein ImpJ